MWPMIKDFFTNRETFAKAFVGVGSALAAAMAAGMLPLPEWAEPWGIVLAFMFGFTSVKPREKK